MGVLVTFNTVGHRQHLDMQISLHVCGVLAKRASQGEACNLRMDREGRLTRIKDAKLAGEQIVEMTERKRKALLQWSRGQTWVEDVYGVIKTPEGGEPRHHRRARQGPGAWR